MKTLRTIAFNVVLTVATALQAQETGIIKGSITDEKGKAFSFVTVALMEDSTLVTGATTDDSGDFTFKQLIPGMYNLQLSFVGYKTKMVKAVEVKPNVTSYIYKSMKPATDTLGTIIVVAEKWEKPIFDATTETVTAISIEQIENIVFQKSDIIMVITALTPGILATDDGKDIYMRGSRRGSTAYIIDGNRVIGSPEVPGPGISGMEVLTGGMPAEYGDCTGGLVIITTKDFKTEMRRKQIAKTEREERQENKVVPLGED